MQMLKRFMAIRITLIVATLIVLTGLFGCTSGSKSESQVPGENSTASPTSSSGQISPEPQSTEATPAPTSSPTSPVTQVSPEQQNTAEIPAPTRSSTSPGGQKPIVGIMGAYTEDFDLIKNWGANTAHYYKYPQDNNRVSSVLDSAKKAGINLLISVAKVNQLNDSFDLASVTKDPDRFFPDHQAVADDPAFLGYWVVDEPCNPKKRSPVQAEDFTDLYATIKGINPNIGIAINFGDLSCLQGFINASQPGWKLTDIALFTITEKKLRSRPDYISEQAGIAASIKTFDPEIIILPQIAVLEFKEKNAPMTPAAWAESTGIETAKHFDSFDGMLYYSFHSYENVKFIGKSIADVKDDPAYVSAFKAVFAAAAK